MLNRRAFFGGLLGAGAVAVSTPRPVEAAHVEPMPTRLDFESTHAQDVNCHGIMWVLEQMGWESEARPQPLLVVGVENYPAALSANAVLNNLCAVRAVQRDFSHGTYMGRDAWFVAWRGRRMGSDGA